MRPFRFRPQPALDVRLRQLDAAEQAHARARAELAAAADAYEAAAEARAAATTRHTADLRGADALVLAEWHRNWMVALEQNVARARQVLDERQIDERRAAETAREARKQVKVLERLKARAWRAWQLDTRRAEQKALDELASLRFASRMGARFEDMK